MQIRTEDQAIINTVLEAMYQAEDDGDVRRVFKEDGTVYFVTEDQDGNMREFALHTYEVK